MECIQRAELVCQRLIEAVSPSHGRVLIYVWAMEQDDASKRVIPQDALSSTAGRDVLVPWVLSAGATGAPASSDKVLNRYYHMFARGELSAMVLDAAGQMGLEVGKPEEFESGKMGLEVVKDDWERSNYYVELRRWSNNP